MNEINAKTDRLSYELSLKEIFEIDNLELRTLVLNQYLEMISKIESSNVGKFVLNTKRGWTLFKILQKYRTNFEELKKSDKLFAYESIRYLEEEMFQVENTHLSEVFSFGDVITFLGYHNKEGIPYDFRHAKTVHQCQFCNCLIAPHQALAEFRPWFQNHSDHSKRGTIVDSIYTCEWCIHLLPENIRELEFLYLMTIGSNPSLDEGFFMTEYSSKFDDMNLDAVEIFHRFKNRIPRHFWFNVESPLKEVKKEATMIKKLLKNER